MSKKINKINALILNISNRDRSYLTLSSISETSFNMARPPKAAKAVKAAKTV